MSAAAPSPSHSSAPTSRGTTWVCYSEDTFVGTAGIDSVNPVANMVTSNGKNNSQHTDESVVAKLLNKTNYKWDLADPKVRDAWVLRTRQRLEDRGEDVLRAALEGPPTPEWVMSKNNTLTPRQAEKASADLMDDYHIANAEAYGILLDKIDLEKRASLANRIARHADDRDGHAVWLIVSEACDFSTGARQDAIVDQYDKFALSSPSPDPEKLKDDLHDMHALWLKLSPESGTKSLKALIRKSLKIPAGCSTKGSARRET